MLVVFRCRPPQVENTGALKLVSVTPQVLAKAKDAVGGRNKMKGRKKARAFLSFQGLRRGREVIRASRSSFLVLLVLLFGSGARARSYSRLAQREART